MKQQRLAVIGNTCTPQQIFRSALVPAKLLQRTFNKVKNPKDKCDVTTEEMLSEECQPECIKVAGFHLSLK